MNVDISFYKAGVLAKHLSQMGVIMKKGVDRMGCESR